MLDGRGLRFEAMAVAASMIAAADLRALDERALETVVASVATTHLVGQDERRALASYDC